MLDRIVLTGMQFYGYHGVLPEEVRLGQSFLVDVELFGDFREAGQNDNLKKTVDYGKVWQEVKTIVEGQPYKLIESVAERVAMTVLETFPTVEEIIVRVHKPKAPIPGPLSMVSVEIHRGREQ